MIAIYMKSDSGRKKLMNENKEEEIWTFSVSLYSEWSKDII